MLMFLMASIINRRNVDVLIEGNLIKEVAANISNKSSSKVIEAKGMTLMPGLIDGHTHMMNNSFEAMERDMDQHDLSIRAVTVWKGFF